MDLVREYDWLDMWTELRVGDGEAYIDYDIAHPMLCSIPHIEFIRSISRNTGCNIIYWYMIEYSCNIELEIYSLYSEYIKWKLIQ